MLKVLRKVDVSLETVLVDGYVWLGNDKSPGLGAHLFEALDGKIPVIGVAKTKFASAVIAKEIFRGNSRNPLYVTSAGINPDVAVQQIENMHGQFRIPTLLKRVDTLCRQA